MGKQTLRWRWHLRVMPITNLDVSRIMINQVGLYSFQPAEGCVPARKVAVLNKKAGLTIKKNGNLDFKALFVESSLPPASICFTVNKQPLRKKRHIPTGMEKKLMIHLYVKNKCIYFNSVHYRLVVTLQKFFD